MLAALLAEPELDRLADLADDAEAAAVADSAVIIGVLDDWANEQAIANLLMYPQLIPAPRRAASLLRGLRDQRSYLRLAAAVGLGRTAAVDLPGLDAADALSALLGLIERDADVTASRAALGVAAVLHPSGAAAVLDVLVRHPAQSVRRNLEVALLDVLDTSGLRAVVDGSAAPETARAVLAGDGLDLARPADEQRLLSLLAPVPNLDQWQG